MSVPLGVSRCVLVAAMLWLPAVAWPEMPEKGDLTQEVVVWCHYHAGEFGIEAIRSCVQQDLPAAHALLEYPAAEKATVLRCMALMRGKGWAMVKACADQDIDAAAALGAYSGAHRGVVETCRAEVGKHGAALVKACVDERIGAGDTGGTAEN